MEKLLEHDTFKLKQLKRWLGKNTIFTTRVWPNGNYAPQLNFHLFPMTIEQHYLVMKLVVSRTSTFVWKLVDGVSEILTEAEIDGLLFVSKFNAVSSSNSSSAYFIKAA